MLNKFLLIILLMSAAIVCPADEVQIRPDHPDRYVVVKGDTLWDISDRFLANPWLWPKVWRVNPHIENPHLIYPGDIVALTYIDGKPYLEINGEGVQAIDTTRRDVISREDVTDVTRVDGDDRYVRLEPQIRVHDKERAIPSIPIDIIKQFLSRPLVVSRNEMDDWPYVVSSFDQHLIAGKGNKIYVRGLPEDSAGKRYAIYRKGPAYINPMKDENEILGYEALHVGDALIERTGDPASFVVSDSTRENLIGDRLAEETGEEVTSDFIPITPDHEVSGNLISVVDGVSEIGQYQVVVVDLGHEDGMQVGTVLGVYQSGEMVQDYIANQPKNTEKKSFNESRLVGYLGRPGAKPETVQLPEEYAGVIMVFRTFENLSYALVMEAVGPMHIYDSVRNL